MAIVLFFEFSNGFNDCANMVVTPVITGALEPRKALLLIAIFEFPKDGVNYLSGQVQNAGIKYAQRRYKKGNLNGLVPEKEM